jgi:alkylated DNA repair dioxygenase AlkB
VSFSRLRAELPLRADKLVTRTGETVVERRQTCWLSEPGIGCLAYSGKLMPPSPLTPHVLELRDDMLRLHGERYDAALCNFYDSEAACAYHADPEHGSYWALPTSVVSAGETRRFVFRRIDAPSEVHSFWFFSGDVVRMWGPCQKDFHHAVLKAEGEHSSGDRISVVFKRALVRANGKKGHGGSGARRNSDGSDPRREIHFSDDYVSAP